MAERGTSRHHALVGLPRCSDPAAPRLKRWAAVPLHGKLTAGVPLARRPERTSRQPSGATIGPTQGPSLTVTSTVPAPVPSLPVITYPSCAGRAVVGCTWTKTVSESPG